MKKGIVANFAVIIFTVFLIVGCGEENHPSSDNGGGNPPSGNGLEAASPPIAPPAAASNPTPQPSAVPSGTSAENDSSNQTTEAHIAMETEVKSDVFRSRSCNEWYFKGPKEIVEQNIKNIRNQEKHQDLIDINILSRCPGGGTKVASQSVNHDGFFQTVTTYNY